MKRILLIVAFILAFYKVEAQPPLNQIHTYPLITEEDETIRFMMNSVSADSLLHNIERMSSFYTRRWDSRYIFDVERWLTDRYETYDFDSIVHHGFTVPNSDIPTADNIIALQRGTKYPDEYVVCGAHYDSYCNGSGHPDSLRSPGADDNATGVAGIMEIARILSGYSFERSILYCNFNAEEKGLVGSAAFAKDCADNDVEIVGYLNLDMTGYLKDDTEMHVDLLYIDRDSLFAECFFNFAEVYYPELPVYHTWLMQGDSDFSSFNRNGYAALHPFEDVIDKSPYIHSVDDVIGLSVNNISQSKLFTELVLGVVATVAGLDNNSIDEDLPTTMSLYPNPVTDHFYVQGDIAAVEVFNITGQKILHDIDISVGRHRIDVNDWNKGVYIVRLSDDKGVAHSHKVVVR